MSTWFVNPAPRHNADLRIICFPYAGGNSSTYTPWIKLLPENIELIAVQPPGRSSRMGEPAFTDMDQLIEELLRVIPNLLTKPYIFFGHSLGSRVSFELMTRLQQKGYPLPLHFIASGSKGPHLQAKYDITYHLPDDEFIAKLATLNGTPQEVLENKELMALFLPLLRADFQIAECYRYSSDITFDFPITVFGGQEDVRVSLEDLQSWQTFFSPQADIQVFPGGHFFIESHTEVVLDKLNNIIEQVLNKLSEQYPANKSYA